MNPGRLVSITVAGMLLAAAPDLPAESLEGNWPQYRGPSRNGISTEQGLLRSWPETGPTEVWRRPIGQSFSSLAIVGDRLYTMESDQENEYAVSFDTATGTQIWRATIGGFFEEPFGNGPRSTPTVDGERVFVLSSKGNLLALSADQGDKLWEVDFVTDLGAEIPRRGFTPSVLVVDDLAIIQPGGSEGRSIMAFDKTTGQQRWAVHDEPSGYSSPVVIDFNGVDQLVFLTPGHAMAVRPSGEIVWNHEWAPETDIKPAMPLFVEPNLLFFSASYDLGALALRMKPNGEGVGVEEAWSSRIMRNHFNTSVVLGEHIYGFDNATLKCIEGATGEQRWAKRGGMGKGSLIYADGDFYVLTEKGKILLVEATPEGYNEKGSLQVLEGRSWTEPALADGHLYVRNLTEMVCLKIRS